MNSNNQTHTMHLIIATRRIFIMTIMMISGIMKKRKIIGMSLEMIKKW